jgi:hypothetical protein
MSVLGLAIETGDTLRVLDGEHVGEHVCTGVKPCKAKGLREVWYSALIGGQEISFPSGRVELVRAKLPESERRQPMAAAPEKAAEQAEQAPEEPTAKPAAKPKAPAKKRTRSAKPAATKGHGKVEMRPWKGVNLAERGKPEVVKRNLAMFAELKAGATVEAVAKKYKVTESHTKRLFKVTA